MKHVFPKLFAGAVLALLLSACAGLGVNAPPEEIVAKRAQAWADAAKDGDYKTAYTYTSPNYRKFRPAGAYHANVGGASIWKSATVSRVACEEEGVCQVRLLVEYPLTQADVYVKTRRDQKWLEIDGKWWLYVAP